MASREDYEYSSQAPAPYIGGFLQKGIFPYASQFLKQQFDQYGEADSSPFTYTGQRVADFDPREQYGMQLSDQAIGSYRPYLGQQAGLLSEASNVSRGGYGSGTGQIQRGLGAGRGLTREGAQLARSSIPNLDLARHETAAARPQYGGARQGLGRAELSGYGSVGGFDPRGISRFYDPYEEDVVQQTLKDVREGLAQGDMGMRDQAVQGGAFGGARSRLRRGELAEDTARGAAEAIGGIRSRGYEGARNAAQQAFEAQQGRMAGLGSLQAQLAGQEAGFAGQEAQSALARGQQFGALSTTEAQNQLARAQQLGQLGQQQFGMGLQGGQGLAGLAGAQAGQLGNIGQQYAGMAQALPGLQGQDINRMMGMGGLGRGRSQSLMDLNYQNFTGQYNLPMQTLQNVGSLTAGLGPLAGGYGYAGATPASNTSYAPAGGSLPGYGAAPTTGIPGIYNNYGGFAGGEGIGFGAAGGGFGRGNPAGNPMGMYQQA